MTYEQILEEMNIDLEDVKKHQKEKKYRFKELPYYDPKDTEEKREIAEFMEEYIFHKIPYRGTREEFIDQLVHLFHRFKIRVEDIEEYFEYTERIKNLFGNNEKMQKLFF